MCVPFKKYSVLMAKPVLGNEHDLQNAHKNFAIVSLSLAKHKILGGKQVAKKHIGLANTRRIF